MQNSGIILTSVCRNPILPDLMIDSRRFWIGLVFSLVAGGSDYSQSLLITNISHPSSGGIALGWSSTAPRYVVARSPSLAPDSFQYTGPVLSTNQTLLTNDSTISFYRVSEVIVVDFPDPNLRKAVTNAIMNWYEPRNLVYDIDLKGITTLSCSSRAITNDSGLSALSDLTYLSCYNNQLASLNLTGCTNLSTLYCYNNLLSNLNLAGCASLGTLSCYSNLLPNLNLTGCTKLSWLSCWANQLTNLNVTGVAHLSDLDCSRNQLTYLNLTGCVSLRTLYCYENQLTNLAQAGLTRLNDLDCSENQLTSLNLADCVGLSWLSCWANKLTSLDSSGLAALSALDCSENQLASLNLAGCTNLSTLYCYNNQLTNLDVTGCPRLTLVDCSSNRLTDLSELVTNAARGCLGVGDTVWLGGNPLSEFAVTNQIPFLESAGVTVYYP